MRYLPTSKRGLWTAFFVFLALNLIFLAVMSHWEFAVIDEIWKPDAIGDHVADMTQEQRRVHAWLTATVDVAYPLTYAALFGGLALKAFPSKRWLALPILLCVPVDLIEGVSQVLILNEALQWVAVKAVVTPIKLVLFITGVLIGLIAAGRLWFTRRGTPAR